LDFTEKSYFFIDKTGESAELLHGSSGFRRSLTAESYIQSQVSPWRILGGEIGTGTGFSPSI